MSYQSVSRKGLYFMVFLAMMWSCDSSDRIREVKEKQIVIERKLKVLKVVEDKLDSLLYLYNGRELDSTNYSL